MFPQLFYHRGSQWSSTEHDTSVKTLVMFTAVIQGKPTVLTDIIEPDVTLEFREGKSATTTQEMLIHGCIHMCVSHSPPRSWLQNQDSGAEREEDQTTDMVSNWTEVSSSFYCSLCLVYFVCLCDHPAGCSNRNCCWLYGVPVTHGQIRFPRNYAVACFGLRENVLSTIYMIKSFFFWKQKTSFKKMWRQWESKSCLASYAAACDHTHQSREKLYSQLLLIVWL